MRVFVKVYDRRGRETETYVIPCKDASNAVESLKQEVLGRTADWDKENAGLFQLALAGPGNGAVLCEADAIRDVLQDGDFLCLRTYAV